MSKPTSLETAMLAEKIRVANAAMEAHLEKRFPLGRRVSCYLMHGQINPSKGTVIAHPGGEFAYVRIRLESRKQEVRNVPAAEVRLI